MLPKQHFVYGIVLSLIAMPLFGFINSIYIFFGAFFIDFDHYLQYVIKKKETSLKKAIAYFKSNENVPFQTLHVFHTAEFWIALFLFSYSSDFFLFCLIGVLYHNILDFLEMVLKKWYNVRVYSLLLWFILRFK
ncbi:MAG: hypothetical protein AABW41_00720 [Nanoarchaeota archaeon]